MSIYEYDEERYIIGRVFVIEFLRYVTVQPFSSNTLRNRF